MNQYAEELHNELINLSKRYNINKGILLFEETKENDNTKKNHRVIIFKPSTFDFKVCEFSELLAKCLNVSKTLLNITSHMNQHTVKDFIFDNTTMRHGKRVD